jgi:hypothetical protein
MAMRALDRAVLMRDATIVARRLHPVMRAQRIVAELSRFAPSFGDFQVS